MTAHGSSTVIVIGYGNPAREDDGLGPAAAAELEKSAIHGVTVDSDYQLTVEDAANIAEYDTVVFIDASVEGDGAFTFSELEAREDAGFSSHSVSPSSVLGLTQTLFNADVRAYVLAIRGYSFSMFVETMTGEARKNLREALAFIRPMLESKQFTTEKR